VAPVTDGRPMDGPIWCQYNRTVAGETVWLHIRPNDGGTHVLIWHLESEDGPGTLCGQSTHDMEVVTESWEEVFSRCRHCDVTSRENKATEV
jgi:hypothetical protein